MSTLAKTSCKKNENSGSVTFKLIEKYVCDIRTYSMAVEGQRAQRAGRTASHCVPRGAMCISRKEAASKGLRLSSVTALMLSYSKYVQQAEGLLDKIPKNLNLRDIRSGSLPSNPNMILHLQLFAGRF